MVLNRATHHYAPNFIDSCIKQFLNDLYTPIILVQNVSKRDTFVKLPFLGSTSFQIQKRTRKLFTNKLTICNLKIVFRHFLQSKAFSPWKTRCYFQDLFTSIGAAMLPIMVRPNVRICEHLGISHFTGKKSEDWQQRANSDPRTTLLLQLPSTFWRVFYLDQGK